MQECTPAGASDGSDVGQADWPTLMLFAACLLVWAGALVLPLGGAICFALLTLALVLHSSLTHELLHGTPITNNRLATLLGVFQPGLAIPYLRFKRLHLAHHTDSRLTDPYDDPETNYLDPDVWAGLPRWRQTLCAFNNTLFGRMLVGPVLGQWSFMAQDWRAIRQGDSVVLKDWLAHLPGVLVTLWLVSLSPLSLWIYLLACYAALSVLKIRTFLEHRAHAHTCARTVVVEDCGPLAFLFLNNNFHVVHHMHPTVSWYKLPTLYRRHKQRYLTRNDGYVYRSYAQVFALFLWRRKDPVAHPLWQPSGE